MTDGQPEAHSLGGLSATDAVGLVVAAVVLAAGTAASPPPGLSVAGQRVLSVFLAVLVLWLTKPVPYTPSSILAVALLFGLGVVDSVSAAATGFTSSLFFFLLLLLVLANAISTVGLDRQLAHRLLDTEGTDRDALASLARSVLVLALVMPSAMARAVTFVPVVKRFAAAFDLDDDTGFERGSFLVLGHVNPIASMALMTGGGMALVTSEIINTSVATVTWVEWAVLMAPPTVLLYVLGTVAAAVYSSTDGRTTVTTAESGSPADDADPFTREQRIVTLVILATVAAWVLGSFLGVPPLVPAALAVFALALPGIEVVTAEDVGAVNWGVLFLIAAMLSILDVMASTGATRYLVEALTAVVPFAALAHWQVVAVLLGIAVGVRVMFSTGSAAIVVALPIVLEFAATFDVNRLYLALAVLLVVGSTTILPFNTTAVLVSMDRGPVTHRDVAGFGLVTLALSLLVVAISWLFYWPMLA